MRKNKNSIIIWELWVAIIADKQPICSSTYKVDTFEMFFSNKGTAEKCLASMKKRPRIIGAGINRKSVYNG